MAEKNFIPNLEATASDRIPVFTQNSVWLETPPIHENKNTKKTIHHYWKEKLWIPSEPG